jgi:hypothetical protein
LKTVYESHKEQKRQLERQLTEIKNQIGMLRRKKN